LDHPENEHIALVEDGVIRVGLVVLPQLVAKGAVESQLVEGDPKRAETISASP